MPGLKLYSGRPRRQKALEPAPRIPELPDLAEVRAAAFETEIGCMAAAWQGGKLTRLTFGHDSTDEALEAIDRLGHEGRRLAHAHKTLVARLQAYARGMRDDFRDVPVLLDGLSEFGQQVIRHCREIGYGCTLSYGQLAVKAGSPGAARAVGTVMANNRIPLIIPCHRVIASAGAIGGFSARNGVSMKRRLLELEGTVLSAKQARRASVQST